MLLADGERLSQTASIGVASWDASELPDAFEDRADRAMYAAKRRGRNRVALADAPLVATSDSAACAPKRLGKARRAVRTRVRDKLSKHA
jgi:predicted signal transduction protein with EAL and GGDEF domain